MQYLHGQQRHQGYQADGKALEAVAAEGCEALLEWLVQQPGCLERLGGASPYSIAAEWGDRGVLDALWRLGVPWGAQDVVARAVHNGCKRPGLQWLVQRGAPAGTQEEMEAAITRRQLFWGVKAEELAWFWSLV